MINYYFNNILIKKPGKNAVHIQCLGDDIEDKRLKVHLLRLPVRLYVCKNKFLVSINRCTFRNNQCSKNTIYPRLWGISLRNNNIKQIHEETFMALQYMTLLILDNNEIESLPKYIFRYNTQLTNINLNGNHLTHIHKRIFINNAKLIKIQLLNNKIKHFIIKSNQLLQLKRIYLHGNPLESLDEDTFAPFFSYRYYYNHIIITFDTSSFTCYSMLSNMSWLIDTPYMKRIYNVESRVIINSMLVYDKYIGTIGLRNRRNFNSYNNDFYKYLLMRITNCNIKRNSSTS